MNIELPCFPRTLRARLGYVILVMLICGIAAGARAQDALDLDPAEEKGPLTVKNLIGTAVSVSGRSYTEIEKAIQRFKNGDAEGALDYLNQAKEKYPQLPPTDITFAKMHLAARNNKAVRFLLERVAVEHPDDPEVYLLLADQAFVGGRITEALALFDIADPLVQQFTENDKRKDNFQIRVIAGRSAVAERRQQWVLAQELLNQWIELDPESAAARQRLGVVQFKLDNSREALAMFQEARELSPEIGHPFVMMARLFLLLGIAVCMRMMVAFQGSFTNQLFAFSAFMLGGGAGMALALGYRNPSNAIFSSSLLTPVATFYVITSFLQGSYAAAFLVAAATYGFAIATMLVPAVDEFDVATGRTTSRDG